MKSVTTVSNEAVSPYRGLFWRGGGGRWQLAICVSHTSTVDRKRNHSKDLIQVARASASISQHVTSICNRVRSRSNIKMKKLND